MNVKNFSENLEKDLGRLTAEITERRQQESPELPDRHILKKSLEVFIPKEADSSDSNSVVVNDQFQPKDNFMPSYVVFGENKESQEKIQTLVDLALKEGLTEAWKAARREAPFVIDAFHDALVDKLLPELKRRGVIKD
ncbi:MAG: hypothetical protein Q8P06_00080 [Candidatus Azambacteria bacterium]|nr:hypothetical protein [Candidatus Azambacteria bacterium]